MFLPCVPFPSSLLAQANIHYSLTTNFGSLPHSPQPIFLTTCYRDFSKGFPCSCFLDQAPSHHLRRCSARKFFVQSNYPLFFTGAKVIIFSINFSFSLVHSKIFKSRVPMRICLCQFRIRILSPRQNVERQFCLSMNEKR
jgi:hypothetical protein